MKFKVAFIGAGSITFTRELLRDILAVKEFSDIDIAFCDINGAYLEMARKLCQKDIDSNNLKIKISATTDRKIAFKDAKYIINCVRIGGLDAFESDIEIPLKYGVDQCVGDTLCAGGVMYGQRGIAAMLEFCKDIKEVAHKDCLFLNYANPNAMLTWAIEQTGVRVLGLCHGVQHGEQQFAKLFDVDYKDIETICAGINHQTWYLSIKHKGVEIKDKLLKALEKHPEYSRQEKVRIDMLKRFGYYSTESNGHLSEYVAWYRKRPNEIQHWISMDRWIFGETGGYLRFCRDGRNWFETDIEMLLSSPSLVYEENCRSVEHAGYIIEALETGRVYRGCFNVKNNGTITNLPDDAIVEVPCIVDGGGISVPKVGDLPMGCAAVCNQSISVQRLAVQAALSGDEMLLKQAVLLDPLCSAVLNPPEVWQMVDEMLVANEKHLPQYKDVIKQAKIRLKDKKINTKEYGGAARRDSMTPEEIRKFGRK